MPRYLRNQFRLGFSSELVFWQILGETLLYTSGIWEKSVNLLRVTVEFESNTTRAESLIDV